MKDKLYILEKIWKYRPGIKLDEPSMHAILVRPCNVSFNTYRRFAMGLPIRCKNIVHEGCVASWILDYSNQFSSLEEFMIYVNVQKCIVPQIENHIIEYLWKSYCVKTIDLKANEVLYDNVDNVIKKLSET